MHVEVAVPCCVFYMKRRIHSDFLPLTGLVDCMCRRAGCCLGSSQMKMASEKH
jgi:hypothetical protein